MIDMSPQQAEDYENVLTDFIVGETGGAGNVTWYFTVGRQRGTEWMKVPNMEIITNGVIKFVAWAKDTHVIKNMIDKDHIEGETEFEIKFKKLQQFDKAEYIMEIIRLRKAERERDWGEDVHIERMMNT